MLGELECEGCLEGYFVVRESGSSAEEVWVESEAALGESAEFGRVFGVVCREHASGGDGGEAWFCVVEYGNASSVPAQLESRGEADDSSTSDGDVWLLHLPIVETRVAA